MRALVKALSVRVGLSVALFVILMAGYYFGLIEGRLWTAIYVERGLDQSLASSVATQLMQHDALAAHGRDELGISDTLAATPVTACC